MLAAAILVATAAARSGAGEPSPDLREVAGRVLPSVVTLYITRTAEVPADLPPEIEGAWRGIVFEDVGGEVYVARVVSGSPGARAGLVPRLRVKEAVIAGVRTPAKTVEDFRKELAAAEGRPVALLTDKTGYLAVPAR